MGRIRITISPGGNVHAETPDGQNLGKECLKHIEFLKALGELKDVQTNRDFNYQHETEVQIQTLIQ